MIQIINETKEDFLTSILEGIREVVKDLTKQIAPKENDYLTRQETASLLKIDLSTLHSWTKKGKLISYGIQGRVYYKRADIENAMVKLN